MAEHWTVDGQRETTAIKGAQFVDVIEVSFTTDQGVTGTVDIPKSQYSADKVAAAIDAYVEKLHAVQGL